MGYDTAQMGQRLIKQQIKPIIIHSIQDYMYNQIMQSKYRKLYLYASSKQPIITKKPNQTAQEYTLKKQKSIEHLKQLLDIKITLPPVSQLSFIGKQKQLQVCHEGSKFSAYKIKRSKDKLHKANHITSSQFLLPSANRIIQISESFQLQAKDKQQSIEEQRQKKYEKYINDYMEEIQKKHVLDKLSQEDYKNLIQQACKDIRKKIMQDENQIQEVQKGLQQSSEYTALAQRRRLKNKSLMIKISPKNKRKKLQILSQLSNTQIHNTSIKQIQDKLILRQNNHKKSKSVADNNLYKLTLQNIERINELKNKQRKRSQKHFVRNLTRISLVQTVNSVRKQ